MTNPYLQNIDVFFKDAANEFSRFKLGDIDEDGHVAVIVDTLLSSYGHNENDIRRMAAIFGYEMTTEDIEYDGGVDALEDAVLEAMDDLNERKPESMPGQFYAEWHEGGYYIFYGGDREDFEQACQNQEVGA